MLCLLLRLINYRDWALMGNDSQQSKPPCFWRLWGIGDTMYVALYGFLVCALDYEWTVWLLCTMCFVYCDIRTLKSSAQLDMTASSSTWMTARGRAKKSRISWRPGEQPQSLPPSLTRLPLTLDVFTAIHSDKPSLVHSHITEGVLQLLKSFKKGKISHDELCCIISCCWCEHDSQL